MPIRSGFLGGSPALKRVVEIPAIPLEASQKISALICWTKQIGRGNCYAHVACKPEIRFHVNFNLASQFKLIWGVQSLSQK
jgi:hypothetical protein